jgi:type IV pilus assembly protein PilX
MTHHTRHIARTSQSGVVLVITLVVLVAMTLAAIALMRSVDTTNIIAGNLAFQRTTLLAADAGSEQAINVTLPFLDTSGQFNVTSCSGLGYKSFYEPNLDPPNQTWEAFWNSVSGCALTLPKDTLGNTVSYVIERLCSQNGKDDQCLLTPPTEDKRSCAGSNLGGVSQCALVQHQYFRITSRSQGPRNTVSYIQTIVAM